MDRKDLRAPDEFVVATTSMFQWVQENSRTMLAVAGAIVVVLAGIGLYLNGQATQRREANAELSAALATLRDGQFQQAAAAFDDVAAQWQASEVGRIAALLAASGKLRGGDTAAALKTLGGIDSTGLAPALRQQRDVLWAAALEANGEWKEAAARYAAASATTGPFTPDAIVGEARCWGRAGERERSAELYRKALADFPERVNQAFIEAQAS